MVTKWLVLVLFMVILYTLGSALYALLKHGQQPQRMAKALTWRIALSLLLFAILMLGYAKGWLKPHALIPAGTMQKSTAS
jgi:hypothetical protein